MKRLLRIIGYTWLVMGIAGCASLKSILLPSAPIDTAPLPAYSGPKARMIVADFEVKVAKATRETGSGLRQMLVTALINSNRFSMVESQASPDLIITVAVTGFEPQASGGTAGVGGGGGVASGIWGGLLGTALNKAHLALDLRIIDVSTSEVLATTHLQGQALEVGRITSTGLLGKEGLGTGLSAYANSPMEKAIRICIIEAARYISGAIPQSYYKHK